MPVAHWKVLSVSRSRQGSDVMDADGLHENSVIAPEKG